MLAAAVAAQDYVGAPGNADDGGRYGQDPRRRAAERKGPRRSASFIPRDEGSKLYEPPPGAEATPMPPEPAGAPEGGAAAPPALTPEDAADNMRTVLETRLAATGGLWKTRDAKTGKPRSLKLQSVGAAKDEGDGRWSGRALFRDKAGAVPARLLVDLSGARWRVLRLEPEAPPAAKAAKPASGR